MSEVDPCDWCEEVIQPYLDRDLNETDVEKVKQHLAACSWCEKRFKFESGLRRLVRQAVGRADGAGAEGQAGGAQARALERLGHDPRQVDVSRRAEVVARDEQRRQRACALVRDLDSQTARASTTGCPRLPS